MVQITYIFMVMRNKIVLDQLPDRAARLKVLPFASFTPIAVVGTARCVSDIIQYAHFPGTQLQCLGVQQTGQVHHCHGEVRDDASHIIRQLLDQPGCRYRIVKEANGKTFNLAARCGS